jgi:hypothetical protein
VNAAEFEVRGVEGHDEQKEKNERIPRKGGKGA